MPTGYTDPIARGMSFTDFALTCARAFGACIGQRDSDLGPNLTKDVPYDRSAEAIDLHERVKAMAAQTPSEVFAEFQQVQVAAIAELDALEERKSRLQTAYEAMLAQVEAWEPPSPDHVELKEFMRKQITDSIAWDCDYTYCEEARAAWSRKTAIEWDKERIASARESLTRLEQSHKEDVARCESRNAWKDQLLKSLAVSV